MHHGRLITLFSARNYFTASDGTTNDAAMLLLAADLRSHLRVHPKRLAARLEAPTAEPADWRAALVGALARCLHV